MDTALVRRFLAVLVGVALVAGCGPVTSSSPTPSETAVSSGAAGPTSTATAALTPLATASPTPIAAATPIPVHTPPTSTTAAATLPVRSNAAAAAVELAPAGEGRLYVATPATRGTLLALLDAQGEVSRGWPVLLKGASACALDADPADASARAVCVVGESETRAFALDAAGRLMAGWPVDLPGSPPTGFGHDPFGNDPTRLVDGALFAIAAARDGPSMLVRIARDGSVRSAVAAGSWFAVIGPDGTAYLSGGNLEAFDLDGASPGFPIEIGDHASAPAFGPGGRFYLTSDDWNDGEESSQVMAFSADGRVAPGWPVTVPIATWTGFGDCSSPPYSPVVASDGSVYVTGWDGTAGVTAYALGPSGALLPGWPFRSEEGIFSGRPTGPYCPCQPCVVPQGHVHAPPLLGPADSLLLAQDSGRESGSLSFNSGRARVNGPLPDRVAAVSRDGAVKAGWPVTLVEVDAWFQTLAVGDDDTVFGFAIEPSGTRPNECGGKDTVYSGTVVALDGHGDPIYTTTIIAP